MVLSPGRRLRQAMESNGVARVMAAHNVISAQLVAEAGFDGAWSSGFELSAAHGLADTSLVTMSQHLESTRAMAERGGAPVVADLDTGYGNAVNLMFAVEQYERAGVGAIVFEDKLFPKMTSLAGGARQSLVRVAEFQGKIAAARAARKDPDLLIVARTEALIAGLDVPDALRRARAYEEAGADLILVHSKRSTPDEIETFVRAWQGRQRLVIVPTAYPMLRFERIKALEKIAMVIYGNHAIRSCVAAMRATFASVAADGDSSAVEATIASVDDVFRLQNMDDVDQREKRFLR